MPKKNWKKPVSYIINIGPCKYCKNEMENTESFVAFIDKTKAHYQCMKDDDAKRSEDASYESN